MPVRDAIYPVKGVGLERIVLAGNLKGAAGAAVATTDYEGIPGAVWAHTGVGTYTLTLPGVGTLDIQAISATVQTASVATAAKWATCTGRNETTRVLTFTVFATTLADGVTAASELTTSEYLNVVVWVKNVNLPNR